MACLSESTPAPGRLARLLLRFRRAATAPSRPVELRRVDVGSIGRGFADPQHPGKRRIVVTIDEATFERVRALAITSEISLAAAARQLIERGFSAPATTP